MSDAPESTQSATKRKTGGRPQADKSRHQSPTAGTIAPTLDDETAAALTLYNTYLIADREQQAHERALKKAGKAKDDAAAAVRKLNDRKAPAAEMTEAETRYREAAEALQRLRDGDTEASEDTPEDDDKADAGTAETTDGGDAPAEDDTSEDSPAEDSTSETVDEASSVGVEASIGDEDLAGDEPAGVAG